MFRQNKLDDKIAHGILLDPVDFKMVLTKYHLEKNSDSIPLNYDWSHFVLEYNVESFLFYANLAIEILGREINSKFNFFEKRSNFSFYDVKNKLDSSNLEQKQILGIIEKYFQKPKQDPKIDVAWDYANTYLWQLREMRNHVAHKPVINRAVFRGSNGDETMLLFRFYVNKTEQKLFQKILISILLNRMKCYLNLYTKFVRLFHIHIRHISTKIR